MTQTAAEPPLSSPSTSIVRPREGRIVAGVCAGIAQRWNLDVTLVRVVAAVLTVLSGVGLAAYLAVWALTPSADGPAPLRPGSRPARLAARIPALVVVLLGLALLASLVHTWWWFGPPLALLVIAALAAVAIGTRGGRWLLGMAALVVALGIGAVGLFGAHFGTRSIHVASASDLRQSYDYGAGTVRLDLSAMPASGSQHTAVHLGRGDIDLTVPQNRPVAVHAISGLGSVTVDGHRVSGVDAEQRLPLDGTTDGSDKLTVDLVVGVGRVDVHTK